MYIYIYIDRYRAGFATIPDDDAGFVGILDVAEIPILGLRFPSSFLSLPEH